MGYMMILIPMMNLITFNFKCIYALPWRSFFFLRRYQTLGWDKKPLVDPWTYEIIMDSYIINQIRNVSPLSFPIATSRPIDQRARAEAISRRALPLQASPWLLAGLRGARMKSRKPIKNPNPKKKNISPAPKSDLHNDCRKGCAIGCMSSHPVAGSRNPRPSFVTYQVLQ